MKASWLKQFGNLTKTTPFHLAFVALLVSLCGVVFITYGIYQEYPKRAVQKTFEKTRVGINQELSELMEKGNEVASIPKVVSAIASEDSGTLSEILPIEKEKRGINLMKVVNKDGVVIVRTVTTNAVGDNTFINSPIGRKMVQSGQSVASVETSAVDARQLIISTGRFVYRNNVRIGALTATYLADDIYATHFANAYLPEGSEVAFYTKEYGLAGTSITIPVSKKLIEGYLKPELDIIQNDNTEKLIRLPDGKIFIVRNMFLPGVEGSAGGVLIFTQLKYINLLVIIDLLIPLAIFFIVLFKLRRHYLRRGKKISWCCPSLDIFVIIYFLSCLTLLLFLYGNLPKFKMPVYPLYNSVLRLQPEGGIFDSRFPQRISVILDSGGEAINAIRLSLSYNPSELKVQSIDMDRSICENFILSEHNSKTGQIEMECIIPNPGFKGNGAIVGDLFFKAEPGIKQTVIRFNDDSQVLANDGLGTNVLRLAVNSTIRFNADSLTAGKESLLLFSPSHPNPERWYSKKTVALSWAPSLPGRISAVDGVLEKTSASLPPLQKKVLEDGTHHFTVSMRAESGKEISESIAVNIDTTPPETLTLSASETKIKPGGLVRFTASGKDSMSGLQRVFYLKIDDEIFFPIGQDVYIPFPQSGVYTITLRAYDKAGNYSDTSKKITVRRYQ